MVGNKPIPINLTPEFYTILLDTFNYNSEGFLVC